MMAEWQMSVCWGGDLCTQPFALLYAWSSHNLSTQYPRITSWLATCIDSWQVTSVNHRDPLLTSTQVHVIILYDIVVIPCNCELVASWFYFVFLIWKTHWGHIKVTQCDRAVTFPCGNTEIYQLWLMESKTDLLWKLSCWLMAAYLLINIIDLWYLYYNYIMYIYVVQPPAPFLHGLLNVFIM